MKLEDIEEMVGHAQSHVFSYEKCALTACLLFVCGLITLFCSSIASQANMWAALSLTFLPFFLTAALLIGLGVVLVRAYHDEVKKRPLSYSLLLIKSWQTVLIATYLFIPVILLYLVQWVILGLFLLFKEAPLIGDLFGVVLIFVPFLLNLGSLLLCLLSVLVLFVVTPIVALKQMEQQKLLKYALEQMVTSLFVRILLLACALFPLFVVGGILWLAAHLTLLPQDTSAFHLAVQWLFILVPFVLFLTPPCIFFFNMAAEAHIFLQKRV